MPDLLLYESKDLTTHAVCVGMTGSGKTGLGIGLLEEAAIDGIPVIAIDPKGDLSNLLLTFPELRPEDFRPWVDPDEAARQGLTPEQFAARTAERWRKGLAEWGQDAERIARFRDAVDVAIYTPGSDAGLPLSVLRSFAPPPPGAGRRPRRYRERIASARLRPAGAASASTPTRSPEPRAHPARQHPRARLARRATTSTWPALIQPIQTPPFDEGRRPRPGVVLSRPRTASRWR